MISVYLLIVFHSARVNMVKYRLHPDKSHSDAGRLNVKPE